jgi:hypothetical protein
LINSEKISDWLQIVGLFGVIASLLFVSLQMKQTQEIALSAAYQARSDSSLEIRMAPLESEHLLSALTKIRMGQVDALTPIEITAKNHWLGSELIYVENVHYQYISGFVSDEQWNTNFEELKMIFSDPEMREAVDRIGPVMRESYFSEIKKAIAELDSQR